jgi:hypothetical protein
MAAEVTCGRCKQRMQDDQTYDLVQSPRGRIVHAASTVSIKTLCAIEMYAWMVVGRRHARSE